MTTNERLHPTQPKPRGDDCIWFSDHTVQIGVEKCLVVLGIRQSDLPPAGTCLAREHLEPLLIEPMPRSNSELVHQQLEALVEITSVPRAIFNDQGSDLTTLPIPRHEPRPDCELGSRDTADHQRPVRASSAMVLSRTTWCSRKRLKEKFGWLRSYAEPLAPWSE